MANERKWDDALGVVLDGVRHLQMWDSTVIVVHADHGLSVGEFGVRGKGKLLDVDTRVPMVIRLPRLAGPRLATAGLGQQQQMSSGGAGSGGAGSGGGGSGGGGSGGGGGSDRLRSARLLAGSSRADGTAADGTAAGGHRHLDVDVDPHPPLLGGLVSEALVELTDVYPTLCDLCRVRCPEASGAELSAQADANGERAAEGGVWSIETMVDEVAADETMPPLSPNMPHRRIAASARVLDAVRSEEEPPHWAFGPTWDTKWAHFPL